LKKIYNGKFHKTKKNKTYLMKFSEIKELSTAEIVERIDTELNLLSRMKMNHAVSPLDNPNKISETRKTVARLKTELKVRQLQQQSESKE